MLGVRYSTIRNIDFEHLDLHLLVAGEIEVITSQNISDNERLCCLSILKDIMCAAGYYKWAAEQLFIAILTEIEMGLRKWGDDTSRLEQQILMPFPLKRSFSKQEGNAEKGIQEWCVVPM